jgi:hypothetical protein
MVEVSVRSCDYLVKGVKPTGQDKQVISAYKKVHPHPLFIKALDLKDADCRKRTPMKN